MIWIARGRALRLPGTIFSLAWAFCSWGRDPMKGAGAILGWTSIECLGNDSLRADLAAFSSVQTFIPPGTLALFSRCKGPLASYDLAAWVLSFGRIRTAFIGRSSLTAPRPEFCGTRKLSTSCLYGPAYFGRTPASGPRRTPPQAGHLALPGQGRQRFACS